ncbi:MAG: hypothetical protein DRP56_01355 [Planctomycetota bacterium]|nr:MAG: hypothetical protein DRP56_01355 [Planctomycetota bacterium]
MYTKHINLKKRGGMIAFLKKHSRYNTMNSWNQSTSYTNNIKLHNVDKPDDIDSDIWWDILWVSQWQEKLSDLLEEFGEKYNFQWQTGINGKSGGYVVLYQGGIEPSGYESYCTHCGQKNYQSVPEDQDGICGRCDAKTRVNFKQIHMQVFTFPGKSVDDHEDFENWTLKKIRDRVELVQEFDQLCDSIVDAYISTCRNYRIAEEQILVPKTIKVLEPLSGGI